MTTDAVDLAERFRKIGQGWDLQSGEAEMQAHNKALMALHTWLRKGVAEPEVVIRAVQVLLADPEASNVRKRPAINDVFSRLSADWTSAGMNDQHVLVLQGMILAAWPFDLHEGGFDLAQLFEAAWWAVSHRNASGTQIEDWRARQVTIAVEQKEEELLTFLSPTEFEELEQIQAIDNSLQLSALQSNFGQSYANAVASVTRNAFEAQQTAINTIVDNTNKAITFANRTAFEGEKVKYLVSKLLEPTGVSQPDQDSKLELLWWGQARYCSALRRPYRRIDDSVQRLWWMAWESSGLAMRLDVEPSASFLIETVCQLIKIKARKRPLKEWLREFIEALREIHKQNQHIKVISVGARLHEIAKKDALGLPVTWARMEAANTRPSPEPLEKSIRDHCALDPETEIDLEDWTAWLFRESLLDRKLRAQG